MNFKHTLSILTNYSPDEIKKPHLPGGNSIDVIRHTRTSQKTI